jgi:cytochrome c peroxidase
MLTSTLVSVLLCAAPIGSTAALDPLGRGAWFVDASNDEVLRVTDAQHVERFACQWPAQVLVDARGTAYAACRGEGAVRRLTEPAAIWPVGPEPRALAIDESTGALYVALATSNEVVVVSPVNGEVRRRFPTAFEPTAIALFDGALVVGSRRSARVQRFPLATDDRPSDLLLPKPAENTALGVEQFVTKGDALVAIATRATLGALDEPTYYQGPGGSPVAQQLYLLDAGAKGFWLSHGNLRIADVSSAIWLERQKALVLASRGSGAIHTVEFVKKAARIVATQYRHDAALVGVVDDGALMYVFDDVARSIAVTPSNRFKDEKRVATIELPSAKGDSELQRGQQLFYAAQDRHLSASGLACASCHVDGRDDGRTWLGQGAMRQTPALAGRDIAHTAPYGWNGAYEKLEDYIAFTIRSRLRGGGLKDDDLKALTRYVREGLPAVRRPAAAMDGAVARGDALFHSDAVGCASCHPSDGAFSDGAAHDVGSVGRREIEAQALKLMSEAVTVRGVASTGIFLGTRKPSATPQWRAKVPRALDTPSLLGAGLTAPYLHDGSAKTLDEVLAKLSDHMGAVSPLSARERADLIAYVETL